MREVIFSKFSRERKSKYQIVTKLVVENQQKKVIKEPINTCGLEHIQNMKTNMDILSRYYKDEMFVVTPCEIKDNAAEFEFIDGERYDEYLSRIYDEKGYASLKTEIMTWAASMNNVEEAVSFQVSDQFIEIFGQGDFAALEGKPAYTVSNIDMIFPNLILKDGKKYITDYEWVFDVPVPIDYVIYRSLLLSGLISKLDYESKNDLYREIGISQSEMEIYLRMEKGFQKYVSGTNLLNSYSKNSSFVIYDLSQAEASIKKKEISCYKFDSNGNKSLDFKNVFTAGGRHLEIGNLENCKAVQIEMKCNAAIIRIDNVEVITSEGKRFKPEVKTNADFSVNNDYYFSGDIQVLDIDVDNYAEVNMDIYVYHSDSNIVHDYICKCVEDNQLKIKEAEYERSILLKDGDIKYRDAMIHDMEVLLKDTRTELDRIKSNIVWKLYNKIRNIFRKSN